MSEQNVPARVAIDPVKKADLPAVLAIEQKSFSTPWTIGMFERELACEHSRCFCARIYDDGKMVVAAYIIFWLVADEAHLHDLAVEKKYRKKGLALMMMETMKEIARQNEVLFQTLEVRESNAAAIKLYRKCGFVVKGVRPNYYTDTREDALIMWADVN